MPNENFRSCPWCRLRSSHSHLRLNHILLLHEEVAYASQDDGLNDSTFITDLSPYNRTDQIRVWRENDEKQKKSRKGRNGRRTKFNHEDEKNLHKFLAFVIRLDSYPFFLNIILFVSASLATFDWVARNRGSAWINRVTYTGIEFDNFIKIFYLLFIIQLSINAEKFLGVFNPIGLSIQNRR